MPADEVCGISRDRPRLLLIYAPTLRVSGVGSFTAALARLMAEHGWEVTVGLAWGHTFHEPRLFEEEYPDIRTVRMDARTGSEEGRIQALCRTFTRVGPDVVLHSCLNSAFAAVRRLRAAGEGRFTFCVVNHGSFAEHAACLLGNRDVVDQVVCVSRWSRLALSSAGTLLPEERLHHIPNTVSPPTAPCRRKEGRPPRIGYAGRLMPDKRYRDIFPFFRSLAGANPDAELWIAGDGPHADETRSFCGEFPGRVRYWGAVSREELYAGFYPELDLFVNFSAAEGWSLAIGEAMTHGAVPVLSAYAGIFTEDVARPGRTALVFPTGETGAAARLAGALLDDPERLQAMSAAARDLMAREYPEGLFARRWSETLEACLASPRTLPPTSAESERNPGVEGARERLRRLLRRRFPHRNPGGEWPHFSCRRYLELAGEIREAMARHERNAREKALAGLDVTSSLNRLQAEILRQP